MLGWLYILWGAFGVLTAIALFILSLATAAAFLELGGGHGFFITPAAWLLLMGAAALGLGGAMTSAAGRMLLGRMMRGRLLALALAAVNLFIVPFGTALAIYACWTLLNDDARRVFGRPARAVAPSAP